MTESVRLRRSSAEQALHEAGVVARIPPEAEHREPDLSPAESQRIVAAPHVDVDFAPLHRRSGIDDRVDPVVLGSLRRRSPRSIHRQQRRIRGGDAGLGRHARRPSPALAVRGGGEGQAGARRRRAVHRSRASGPHGACESSIVTSYSDTKPPRRQPSRRLPPERCGNDHRRLHCRWSEMQIR